jgi:3-hydroxybutyryl-CoA dehydrogenase
MLPVSRVSIVGSGTMGARIAYRCIVSGLETSLYDKYPTALESAVHRIGTLLAERARDCELPQDQAEASRSRLRVCSALEDCVNDADIVIEAVPENLNLKRAIFAELDRAAPAKAVIATNSSSIPCSQIADATRRPSKVFNINFSDPTMDHLVEIMKGAQTSEETIAIGEQFVRTLHMVPIITWKEIRGFTFNRIWRAIKREALHLVAGGYSSFDDIDRAWMLEFGTPHGPFGLMYKIGLDVVRDIDLFDGRWQAQ